MAITVFLSCSPGLLNRGIGSPAPLGHGHHSSIWSELQLLNRGPEVPLWWVLVFSTASLLQLVAFLSLPGLYNCSTFTLFLWASQIALNSTRPWSRLYPDIPRPDAPIIYTSAFPILTALPGSIRYNIFKQARADLFCVENIDIEMNNIIANLKPANMHSIIEINRNCKRYKSIYLFFL